MTDFIRNQATGREQPIRKHDLFVRVIVTLEPYPGLGKNRTRQIGITDSKDVPVKFYKSKNTPVSDTASGLSLLKGRFPRCMLFS